MVIVDTNVIIDHLRQTSVSQTLLQKTISTSLQQTFAIALVSIQELYQGKSSRDKDEETKLLAAISDFTILPYTYEVAEIAGKITRDTATPVQFADAAIAATAIINDCKLLTLNKKDFENIPQLQLV